MLLHNFCIKERLQEKICQEEDREFFGPCNEDGIDPNNSDDIPFIHVGSNGEFGHAGRPCQSATVMRLRGEAIREAIMKLIVENDLNRPLSKRARVTEGGQVYFADDSEKKGGD